ncbi:MAG: nicotinamide riboside transporter PnuC, partial [Actinomycetales bacterium]|nr:nicotinamide riboside transporter PnuC [Actinomycetales bacterium]
MSILHSGFEAFTGWLNYVISDWVMQPLITVLGYELSRLEFIAVIASLIGVWLGTTGATWTWPWWALSSALYAWLFYEWNLLASSLLQFVFIAAAIWGWLGWGPKGAQPKSGNMRQYLTIGLSGLLVWIIIAPLLAKWGAAATWPDSFGLVFSVIAQVIMVLQYRENWALWFIVDAVYTI